MYVLLNSVKGQQRTRKYEKGIIVKNTITEVKNALERSNSRLDNREECTSKLEETRWITQSEEREKKKKIK